MLGLFVYFVSFALKVPRGKRHLQLFQVCPIISQVEIRLGKFFSIQPGFSLHLKERQAKKEARKQLIRLRRSLLEGQTMHLSFISAFNKNKTKSSFA